MAYAAIIFTITLFGNLNRFKFKLHVSSAHIYYIALNSTPPYDQMNFRFSNVFTQQQTADFIPRPEKEMAGKQTVYMCR